MKNGKLGPGREDFSDVNIRPAEKHETDVEKINNGKLKITMEKVNMSALNITETKDVVILLAKVANASVESLADDGKITVADVFKFGGAATALFPAIAGISQVPAELADLDPIEKDELIALVKQELNLEENVELVVEKALTIAAEIKELIDLVKQLKAV